MIRYKINKKEIIFFLMYIVYLLVLFKNHTVLKDVGIFVKLSYVRYLCYLVAVILIIRDSYKYKQLWTVFLIGAIAVLSLIFSGNQSILFYTIILLSAKDIDVRKIIKVTCVMQCLVLVALVGLSQMGLVQDYIFDPDTRARHGLGFLWTTTPAILYFFIVASYIYLRQRKIHTIELIVLELINVWFFKMTNTRLCFLLTSVVLIYVFGLRYYLDNKEEKIQKNKIFVFAPIGACLIAFIIHLGYDATSTGWMRFNKLLSGRLALGLNAVSNNGISLFGKHIDWVGFSYGAESVGYNYVDCSYLKIFLDYGVVSLIVILIAYTFIMHEAIKQKDFYLQTMILAIILFNITEPRLFDLAFNPSLFFAVAYFKDFCAEKKISDRNQYRIRLCMGKSGGSVRTRKRS